MQAEVRLLRAIHETLLPGMCMNFQGLSIQAVEFLYL